MKKLLFAIILIAFAFEGKASHVAGGDITYEYIGDTTGTPNHYRVILTLYRRNESSSVPLSNSATVKVNSSCFNQQTISMSRFTPAMGGAGDGGFYVSRGPCVNFVNPGGGSFYLSRHLYIGYVILPGTCSDIKFSFDLCCRHNSISNIVSPGSTDIYLEALLNNTIGNNSSPQFDYSPRLYTCSTGSSYYQVFQGQEKDGDSIHYSLEAPLDGPSTPVQYNAGYSKSQPASSLNGIQFNSNNALISFQPTTVENALIGIRATEYRYDATTATWNLIGVCQRELILMMVPNCRSGSPASLIDIDSLGFDQSSVIECRDSIIKLKLQVPIMGDSISSDASEFRVKNHRNVIIPITAYTLENILDQGLYTNEIWLYTPNPFLYKDTLTISLKKGSDGNSLITMCYGEVNDTSFTLVVDSCADFFDLPSFKNVKTTIYPNPVSDFATLRFDDKFESNVVILTDITGRVVLEAIINEQNPNIDCRELKPGLYFVNVLAEDGSHQTISIIKN